MERKDSTLTFFQLVSCALTPPSAPPSLRPKTDGGCSFFSLGSFDFEGGGDEKVSVEEEGGQLASQRGKMVGAGTLPTKFR